MNAGALLTAHGAIGAPQALGALARALPQWQVEHVAHIDSTNAELLRRARAGDQRPTLLVAEHQSAGRGRLGRRWEAAPGAALTFSLGLPLAPAQWDGLSLVVGVAVAEALHPHIGLKWPNDLWWRGRKLGGILVETAGTAAATPADTTLGHGARHAVIGIGLNLIAPPASPALRTPAAGLRELDAGLDAATALARVAPAVVQALHAFAATGFAAWQARYATRDVLAGQRVHTSDGRAGVARGVALDGALLLQTDAGAAGADIGALTALRSQEVSVRPIAHAVGATTSATTAVTAAPTAGTQSATAVATPIAATPRAPATALATPAAPATVAPGALA